MQKCLLKKKLRSIKDIFNVSSLENLDFPHAKTFGKFNFSSAKENIIIVETIFLKSPNCYKEAQNLFQ